MVESYSKNANHNMRRPVVKEEIVSFMRERQAPVTDALKELEEFARRENIPIIPHETVAFFRFADHAAQVDFRNWDSDWLFSSLDGGASA